MKRILALTILLVASLGVSAKAQLIDIQFGGNTYNSNGNSDVQVGGGEAIGSSATDYWNDIVFTGSQFGTFTTTLNNVGNISSGVSLSILSNSTELDEYSSGPVSVSNPTPSKLPGTSLANLYEGFLNADSYVFATPTSSTFTFSGLTAGQGYSLYIYSAPNNDRASDWSLNGATPVQVGTNSGATILESPNNYIALTGTANGSGNLVLTASSISGTEIDVNGFQLQATATPEPSTYAMIMVAGLVALVAIRRKRSTLV